MDSDDEAINSMLASTMGYNPKAPQSLHNHDVAVDHARPYPVFAGLSHPEDTRARKTPPPERGAFLTGVHRETHRGFGEDLANQHRGRTRNSLTSYDEEVGR